MKQNSSPARRRTGVFVGAYVPPELKRALREAAVKDDRTASAQLRVILARAFEEADGAVVK